MMRNIAFHEILIFGIYEIKWIMSDIKCQECNERESNWKFNL